MAKTERSFVLSPTTIFIMLTSAVFASLFLLASAQPWKRSLFIESITDCSQLPSYSNDTKIAGPWTIKVDSCYNGTSPDGLCSIEGFESGSDITRQRGDRPNTIEHGFVSSHLFPMSIYEHLNAPIKKTMTNGDLDHHRKRQKQPQNPAPLQRPLKHNRSIRAFRPRRRRPGLARRWDRPPPQHGATGLGQTRRRARTGVQTLSSR